MTSHANREGRISRPEHGSVTVTDAQPGRSVDRHHRQRNYLIAMSIRVACFFGLIVTPSPWRWAFAAGAIVIPTLAVMLANVSSTPYTAPTAPGDEDSPVPGTHQLTAGEVIPGEVIPDPAPGDDDA